MEENRCIILAKRLFDELVKLSLEESRAECAKESFDAAIKEILAELLGVEPNPVDCEKLLAEPPTEKICKDFYEQRKWVMCYAHKKMKEAHERGEIASLSKTLKEAWEELRKKCAV